MTQWKDGAALATRTDFERAAEARASLLDARAELMSSLERQTWEAALAQIAPQYRPRPEPIVLDGATWRSSCRSARMGRCRRCEVCLRELEIERASSTVLEREPLRRWPFEDVATALESWVAWREDPAGARSSLGPQLERLRDGLAQGERGGPIRAEDTATRAASLFVDVERALLAACTAAGAPSDLTGEAVLVALAATVVGVPTKRGRTLVDPLAIAERWALTPRATSSVLRRAKGRAGVELAARWLVPMRGTDRDDVEQVRARLMEGKANR